MPFRSKQTLESWLDEFRATREGGALINVLIQDGEDGADTGLVVVPLRNEATEIYMQPATIGDEHWTVTLGTRPSSVELSSLELQGLVAELAVAAALCQFLQDKSAHHDEPVPGPEA